MFPEQEKTLNLMFDTDPAKAKHLKSIIYREIEKIATDGPTAEDMDKVIKNLLKNREQSKLHNSYWISALTNYYLHGINNADPKNFEDILAKVTAAQVQEFVKTFLAKADVVDVIFKPKADEVAK